MMIKALYIDGFGKFKDQTFEFSSGLNIIEGLNESGKSTLHAFIEGILYGFLNPLIKNKRLTEKHEKYEPQDTEQYGGSLLIEKNKKTYRITRNLKKNARNPVQVIDEITGKDITNTLDLHPTHNIVDIAKWLDLPYLVYLNTLSVSQQDLSLNNALERDLLARLQNLDSTASLSLSIDKAKALLKKQKDDIGTDNPRSKKPYRETIEKLESFKQERENVIQNHALRLSAKTKLEEEKDQLEHKEQSLQKLKTTLEHQENQIRREQFKKIKHTHQTIQTKTIEYNNLKPYATFDSNDLDHYKQTTYQKQNIETNLKRTQTSLENLTIKHQEKQQELTASPIHSLDKEAFIEDYKNYRNIARQFNRIEYDKLNNTLKDYETRLKLLQIQKETLKPLKKWYLIILLLPLLYVVLKTLMINIKTSTITKKKTRLLHDYQTQHSAYKTLESIHEKYAINDISELEKIDRQRELYAQKQETLNELTTQINTLKAEINDYKNALKKAEETLETIHEKYDCLNYEGLKNYYKNHQTYTTLNNEITHLKQSIELLLNGLSYEDYQKTIDMSLPNISIDDYEENKTLYRTLDQERQSLALTIAKETQRIESEEQKDRNLEDIEQEIFLYEEKKLQFESELTILENAEKRIEDAIEIIEENFAPLLSDTIGKYLARFTKGRYDTIKVRKDLNFKVELQDSKRLETRPYFSLGTLDQIYFSMRLGVLDAMQKTTAPLFLDDAFTAYDTQRLDEVLNVLNDFQKDRQILLFTCHQRERERLTKQTIKHHFVQL